MRLPQAHFYQQVRKIIESFIIARNCEYPNIENCETELVLHLLLDLVLLLV